MLLLPGPWHPCLLLLPGQWHPCLLLLPLLHTRLLLPQFSASLRLQPLLLLQRRRCSPRRLLLRQPGSQRAETPLKQLCCIAVVAVNRLLSSCRRCQPLVQLRGVGHRCGCR